MVKICNMKFKVQMFDHGKICNMKFKVQMFIIMLIALVLSLFSD